MPTITHRRPPPAISILEANASAATKGLSIERRIERGKEGLSGSEVQMVCRAMAMAGEKVTPVEIRDMNLDEVMVMVGHTPKVPSVKVAQALGLDGGTAARLFDACLAMAERRQVLSLTPNPKARATGGNA